MAAPQQGFYPKNSPNLAPNTSVLSCKLKSWMLHMLAGLIVLPAYCAAGQYYKWVDDKGVTHFSEKPVVGMDAKKVGSSSKDSGPDSEPTSEPSAASAPADAGAATKPQGTNDENCKVAQDRLKALQSGQRIRLVGSDGKFSYLDQNQIKEEVQKTNEVLNANCSK